MIDGSQRRALAAGRHVGRAQVVDHVDAGQLRQQRRRRRSARSGVAPERAALCGRGSRLRRWLPASKPLSARNLATASACSSVSAAPRSAGHRAGHRVAAALWPLPPADRRHAAWLVHRGWRRTFAASHRSSSSARNAGRVGKGGARPAGQRILAVGLDQGHVDAVHGGAAHQPQSAQRLAHPPLPVHVPARLPQKCMAGVCREHTLDHTNRTDPPWPSTHRIFLTFWTSAGSSTSARISPASTRSRPSGR